MTENGTHASTTVRRPRRVRTAPPTTDLRDGPSRVEREAHRVAIRPAPTFPGVLLAACLIASCGGGGTDGAVGDGPDDGTGAPAVREPLSGTGETGGSSAPDPSAVPGDSGDDADAPVTTDPPSGGGGTEDGDAGDREGSEPPATPDGPDDTDGPPDESVLDAGAYGDGFDGDTLSEWTLRHELEGGEAQYSRLDIDGTTPGALTIVPTLTPGWFADGDAPLVFKTVTGDFSVETDVLAESVAEPGLAPGANFNSAGLMARDPSGASGPENHVMVNIGRQDGSIAGGIGSETKSTRDSSSRLELQVGSNRGRLVLCRVGNRFSTHRLLDNESGWTRIGEVTRDDLPATLQVGMVANGFSGPDVRATFEYITLRVPLDEADCLPAR